MPSGAGDGRRGHARNSLAGRFVLNSVKKTAIRAVESQMRSKIAVVALVLSVLLAPASLGAGAPAVPGKSCDGNREHLMRCVTSKFP